jgi:ElaB/YqjD/DUF883 family membrane-anchored ribosome-binding protein
MTGEINTIREDIEKLRDDLGLLLSDVGSYSKDKLVDTRDRLSAAIEAFEGRAYGRLQGTARVVEKRGRQAVGASRDVVQEKPLTYVAAAFVAGMLLASIFDWKRSS